MFLIIPALLAGYCCDFELNRKLHPNRYPCTVSITFLFFPALYFTLHDSAAMIQGLIFAQLLIPAGYTDVKIKEIPDELCGLIFLVSLIHSDPIKSLIGMILISVPLWIFGTAIPGSVGGGDIKLLAACGAVLGPSGIIAGTVLSVAAFLLFLFIRVLLHRKQEKTYAMAPWFGIGCFLAYLLLERVIL